MRKLIATLLVAFLLAIVPGGFVAANTAMGDPTDAGSGGSSGSGDLGGSGGSSNVPPGGGAVGGVSTPRVMLTAFAVTPAEVVAGGTFEITFILENKSQRTRVNNLKVTVSGGDAGELLPVGGSSSTYISTIKAGGSVDRTMAFRSLPTLEERPYPMTIAIEYEDTQANAYTSTENVAVLIKQNSRATTTTPQVMPATIMVGQETSVTFSINNLGKNKLYNATVKVPDGQAVAPAERFVGNIDPGASGEVELPLMAVSEAAEPIRIEVTYEDANGAPTTTETTAQLAVMPMEQAPPMEEPMPPMEEEPQGPLNNPVILAVIGGALLAAVLIAIFVSRAARKRKRERELEGDMSYLDDDPLVPTDPS